MGDVILYKEDVDRLNLLLRDLITDAKILSALLVTKDTRVLACQGTLSTADTGALAALLVGSFASTQAIAGLIGETEFDTMSHTGKSRNVMILLVNEDTILASIFDKNSSCEAIARYVTKHTDTLRKALHNIGGNTASGLFDSAEGAAPDDEDDFEKRTDALIKSSSVPPPRIPETVMAAMNAKHSPSAQPPQPAPPDAVQAPDRHQYKKPHAAPVPAGGFTEMKRPPETHAVVTEPPLASKDYDVYGMHAADNKLTRQTAPPQDKKAAVPQEGAKGETAFTSMSYLKTKAREGALYYHRDKAFFKKFFKSTAKKKA